MPNKTYISGTIVDSGSLNDFNQVTYNVLGDGVSPPADPTEARTNLGAAESGVNSDITSIVGLTTPLAPGQGGTGNTGGAWATAVGVLSTSTGTLSNASASVNYLRMGRVVFFAVSIQIVTNGTAAGSLRVDLPFIASVNQGWGGKEIQSIGTGLVAYMTASGARMVVTKVDNAYPGADNTTFVVTGICYCEP